MDYDRKDRIKKIDGDWNEYWYDADGNRINMYYYHTNMKYAYDCSGGRHRLLWTSDHLEKDTTYAYGADGLLWSVCDGEYRFYHYDYRGSVVAVTDMDGNITDTVKYDAYGSTIERTGDSNLIFGYNGQYGVLTDPNGLLYMRTRFYNPALKRFMNADILEGSISYVDPWGLSAERGQPTIYYGKIDNPEDGKFGDLSKDNLTSKKFITWSDFFLTPESACLFEMKLLARALSVGEMQDVLMEMIDRFASGTGGEYTSDILTSIVEQHSVTQAFMSDVTTQFLLFYNKYDGNVSAFANSDAFKKALRDNGVLLSKYAYGGGVFDIDTYTGLTFAIHQWTSSQVDLTSLHVDGNNYSGTLRFTFQDTFGLDTEDINQFGALAGFRYWYILQHYDKYKGSYVPFDTIVTIDYDFSGKIK